MHGFCRIHAANLVHHEKLQVMDGQSDWEKGQLTPAGGVWLLRGRFGGLGPVQLVAQRNEI